MQEQSAFWLDAKEQLLMDAEIHNKMIASLVQFAATQQAKSPSTTNLGKRGACLVGNNKYSAQRLTPI